MPVDIVITPGGQRPRSMVHKVEAGTVIDGAQGKLRVLHAQSSKVLADFGTLKAHPRGRPLMPHNVVLPTAGPSGLGSGWITYAYWLNDTGNPITQFSTTWIVPPAPATQSGQLIYLFNGIQNNDMIYQPVLQWGYNGWFGGDYWCVASWYADGQGGPAFFSSAVPVAAGQTITGVMTETARSGAEFSYACQFQGMNSTILPIQNVQELSWCVETLECYRMQEPSDYPDVNDTQMGNISIQTGNISPNVSWTRDDAVTDVGQDTRVLSPATVDIFYRKPLQRGSVLAAFVRAQGDARVHWSPDGSQVGFSWLLYRGSSPVTAMIPYNGGVLTAFAQTPGGNRIHWSANGEKLGSGPIVYQGSSPVTAMIAYNGGVLTAFTQTQGYGNRVHWSPDGNNLGAGQIRYDGTSPVTAMIPFNGGVLTAFTQTPGGNRIHWSPNGSNLGAGQIMYEGSSPVTAMIAYNGGVLTAFAQTQGYGNRIHWSPNGANLGGGPISYDGSSRITAMMVF